MDKPVLVLISGAPGTGKTHLARRIADSLCVVVLEKDTIKETLFDALGEDDREWSRMLGRAAFALLLSLLESHLQARQSVVVEANFQRQYAGQWVDQMRKLYDARVLELHCHADLETILSRVARRAGSGERHSGHGPADIAVGEIRDSYELYGPVTACDALVPIDTTNFETIDYAAIIERLKSSLA